MLEVVGSRLVARSNIGEEPGGDVARGGQPTSIHPRTYRVGEHLSVNMSACYVYNFLVCCVG